NASRLIRPGFLLTNGCAAAVAASASGHPHSACRERVCFMQRSIKRTGAGGRMRERLAREHHHEFTLEEVACRVRLEWARIGKVGLRGFRAETRDQSLNACIRGSHADADAAFVPRRQPQTLRRIGAVV